MTRLSSLLSCRKGAAAAEMAIAVPMLVIILAGLTEIGYYFYAEHRLVESVRDASRFAARQPFTAYATCPGGTTPTDISASAVGTQAKLIASKGTLDATAANRLWGWGQTGANAPVFTVSFTCVASIAANDSSVNSIQPMDGIYDDVIGGARVVTVDAELRHNGVFAAVGFARPLELNAQSTASVAGI